MLLGLCAGVAPESTERALAELRGGGGRAGLTRRRESGVRLPSRAPRTPLSLGGAQPRSRNGSSAAARSTGVAVRSVARHEPAASASPTHFGPSKSPQA